MTGAEVVGAGIALVLDLIERELDDDEDREQARKEISQGLRESQKFLLRSHAQQQLDARRRKK